jgi:hypothetical protein
MLKAFENIVYGNYFHLTTIGYKLLLVHLSYPTRPTAHTRDWEAAGSEKIIAI